MGERVPSQRYANRWENPAAQRYFAFGYAIGAENADTEARLRRRARNIVQAINRRSLLRPT
jgi:hypothetical protein